MPMRCPAVVHCLPVHRLLCRLLHPGVARIARATRRAPSTASGRSTSALSRFVATARVVRPPTTAAVGGGPATRAAAARVLSSVLLAPIGAAIVRVCARASTSGELWSREAVRLAIRCCIVRALGYAKSLHVLWIGRKTVPRWRGLREGISSLHIWRQTVLLPHLHSISSTRSFQPLLVLFKP
jgi:hypothetical protein